MEQVDSDAPAQPWQWTKVEDRLPPKFTQVIVANADGIYCPVPE